MHHKQEASISFFSICLDNTQAWSNSSGHGLECFTGSRGIFWIQGPWVAPVLKRLQGYFLDPGPLGGFSSQEAPGVFSGSRDFVWLLWPLYGSHGRFHDVALYWTQRICPLPPCPSPPPPLPNCPSAASAPSLSLHSLFPSSPLIPPSTNLSCAGPRQKCHPTAKVQKFPDQSRGELILDQTQQSDSSTKWKSQQTKFRQNLSSNRKPRHGGAAKKFLSVYQFNLHWHLLIFKNYRKTDDRFFQKVGTNVTTYK